MQYSVYTRFTCSRKTILQHPGDGGCLAAPGEAAGVHSIFRSLGGGQHRDRLPAPSTGQEIDFSAVVGGSRGWFRRQTTGRPWLTEPKDCAASIDLSDPFPVWGVRSYMRALVAPSCGRGFAFEGVGGSDQMKSNRRPRGIRTVDTRRRRPNEDLGDSVVIGAA